MAHLYKDSKTFVDMKLRANPTITLTKFREWQTQHAQPTKADIQKFVDVSKNTYIPYLYN